MMRAADALAFADHERIGARTALRVRMGPQRGHRDITFAQLRDEVMAQAAMLIQSGAQPGQRVALLMPHSERLVITFLGAIWAGLVPSIIAWPTAKMDPGKYGRNIRAVLRNLGAQWLATDMRTATHVGAVPEGMRFLDCHATANASDAPPAAVRAQGTAFIQFSGGTTGTQKSVPIALSKLDAQLSRYAETLELSESDAIISWLPLYHDMGLIACLLMPFVARLPLTMLAPMEWVMDPRPFLSEMAATRSTLCWLPNFAFAFMAQRARPGADDLDLSGMRGFINCSEPVRVESVEAFLSAFEPLGVRSSAMHTCYAMAEATFAVTQTTVANPPRRMKISAAEYGRGLLVPGTDRMVLSCGAPIPGVDVRVVDEGGRDRADGEIGEIWLRGDFMMDGYLDAGRNAADAFVGAWYKTGDLGALVDGHLFVTARKKDVIIVGGVNVYPEDVETAVGEVPSVHPGRVVALGMEAPELGTERLVVVAEVNQEEDLERAAHIEADIRRTIAAVAGVAPQTVHLVPPKWIVKSTAGKISRPETRDKLVRSAGELVTGGRRERG